MTRLLVDALGIDQPGGARTAVLELYAAFVARHPDWQVTFLLSAPEPRLAAPQTRQIIAPVRKGLGARAVAVTLLPILATRWRADVVHCAKSQGALTPGAASVLTLFDATTLRYPQLHRPLAVWTWRHLQPRLARRADAVITLSEDAADDLARFLGLARQRIVVIPCAPQQGMTPPTPEQVAAVRARHNVPDRYLLFVGIVAKKKNLGVVLAALERLRAQGRSAPPLVCVGPRYALSDGGALIDALTRHGRLDLLRYLGPVGSADLAALYGGA
ncbi:MAG: glycosyltransferase, partial [Dehalococcoidia bacterium]|nr:glycosyltransferase [Dehalococcoidia bacterium]